MNVPYLRQLAFERFMNLLLNKSAGDTRTPEELRQIAARQVVKEAQREARITAAKSQPTPQTENTYTPAFESLFKSAWKIVSNQRVFAELMQRRNFLNDPRNSKITPTIIDAPIVCDEPNGASTRHLNNIVAFPKHAPLLSTSLRTATLLDQQEFPKLGGMADETINNFHASIRQNEAIAKERERRSIQYRSQQKQKYVG
jgi:hypothetical protein